jgi:hypothetical protein
MSIFLNELNGSNVATTVNTIKFISEKSQKSDIYITEKISSLKIFDEKIIQHGHGRDNYDLNESDKYQEYQTYLTRENSQDPHNFINNYILCLILHFHCSSLYLDEVQAQKTQASYQQVDQSLQASNSSWESLVDQISKLQQQV